MKRNQVKAIIEAKYEKYVKEVIKEIKTLGPECRQSGDDSGLKDVWEEFKYQMHHGESILYEVYEEDFRRICGRVLKELPKDEIQILWLLTDLVDDRWTNLNYEAVEEELYFRLRRWAEEEPLLSESSIEDLASFKWPSVSAYYVLERPIVFTPCRVVIRAIQEKYERYAGNVIKNIKTQPYKFDDGSISDESLWEMFQAEIEDADKKHVPLKYDDIVLEYEDSVLEACRDILRRLSQDEIELLWLQSQECFEETNNESVSIENMTKGVAKELYNLILIKALTNKQEF